MIKTTSKGQALIIFALAIFGLIAVAALVLDGGQIYFHRRAAQASADAGALAGAYNLCNGGTPETATAKAIQFATTENEGTSATAQVVDGEVRVAVQILQTSFLVQYLGINNVEIPAQAAANCFPPGAMRDTLPIAWSCRPPVGESSSPDCEIQSIDWETEMGQLIEANKPGGPTSGSLLINGNTIPLPFKFKNNMTPEIYIVMDNAKLGKDLFDSCMPNGTINCDIDGDGNPEFGGPGDRSWLLLEEGKGANFISSWIKDGLENPLNIHTWLAGKDGVSAVVFGTIEDYLWLKKPSLLPVFNDVCSSYPYTTPACSSKIHPEDLDIYNGPNIYFHVIGFAAFYVTCVDDGNDHCPAHDAVCAAGIYSPCNQIKSVEGYFVRGVPVDAVGGIGGVDLGVTVRSLTE